MDNIKKDNWWVRFLKVFHILILLFITILVPLVTLLYNYFESFFSHESFLKISGYTLIVYIIVEITRRVVLYITRGIRFFEIGLNGLQKILYAMFLLFFVVGLILMPIDKRLESSREQARLEELKTDYENAKTTISNLQEQYKLCLEPLIEQKLADEMRSCNLLKGKIKHDYNFCVSLTSINSPASCLYDHDYQKIDCSEDALRFKAYLGINRTKLSDQCKEVVTKFSESLTIVNNYEN